MTLARYFVREALKLTAAIITGLFIIYLSMRFATYLGEAAEGKVAPQHITRIVMLKMLVSLKDMIPMALFLGVFGAATRLQVGSEWTAMRAAGVTHQHLLRPTVALGSVAAVIVGLITLVVGPRTELELKELRELTENEATIAGVRAGRFREFSGGSQVFYARDLSADERFLVDAFVQSRKPRHDDVLRADRAYLEVDARSRDRFAVFESGTSWAGNAGQLDYVVTEFERYALRIETREPTRFGAHIAFLNTSELLRRDEPAYAVELQWRLALPLCAMLGPPLAFMVAMSSRRGQWYLGLIVAVSLYFAYTNLLGVGRALMRKEVIPATLGLWPVHLACAAVIGVMLGQHRRLLARHRAARGKARPPAGAERP